LKDQTALEMEIDRLRSEKAALQVQSRLLENFVSFARSAVKERVLTRLLKKTLEISAESVNKIHPVIDRVFKFDQVKEAFAFMQSARHFGKIVIALT